MRKGFKIVDAPEPERLLKGFGLKISKEKGAMAILGYRLSPFEGVDYEIASYGTKENRMLGQFRATVRVHHTRKEAIDYVLASYGFGYAEKPRRGCQAGHGDIGDFSLVSKASLVFVRRNVSFWLVSFGGEAAQLDEVGKALSGDVDRIAEERGTGKIDFPRINLAIEDLGMADALRRAKVIAECADEMEIAVGVLSSEGSVRCERRSAIIEWQPTRKEVVLKASVVTRDAFVFVTEKKFAGAGRAQGR